MEGQGIDLGQVVVVSDSAGENLMFAMLLSLRDQGWRLYYTGQCDLLDPDLSPLYRNLHGLPPMFFQTGTWGILLSDTVDFVAKAKAAGVDTHVSC